MNSVLDHYEESAEQFAGHRYMLAAVGIAATLGLAVLVAVTVSNWASASVPALLMVGALELLLGTAALSTWRSFLARQRYRIAFDGIQPAHRPVLLALKRTGYVVKPSQIVEAHVRRFASSAAYVRVVLDTGSSIDVTPPFGDPTGQQVLARFLNRHRIVLTENVGTAVTQRSDGGVPKHSAAIHVMLGVWLVLCALSLALSVWGGLPWLLTALFALVSGATIAIWIATMRRLGPPRSTR